MTKQLKIFLFSLFVILSIANISFAASADGKVQIDYYWGDGCGHCEAIKPFLDDFEQRHKDDVNMVRHEVWKHPDEAQRFNDMMDVYGVPQNRRGTPTLIVNGTLLVGGQEIPQRLEQEVVKAKLGKGAKEDEDDAVNNLLKGMPNGKAPEVNAPTKAGHKDSLSISNANVGAIALTALVDSVNPCAIMVLIILLSSLVVMQKNKAKIFLTATSFIFAVYLTYFVLGLGITNVLAGSSIAKAVTIAVGGISIFIGLANLKDAFFYRLGNWAIEIPEKWRNWMLKVVMGATSPIGAFSAGTLVTFVELPCTGGPYMFGLSLISHYPSLFERMTLLSLYNFVFVLPLIIISGLVIKGSLTIEKAEQVRNKNVKMMHFVTGIVMLALGIWVVFFRW